MLVQTVWLTGRPSASKMVWTGPTFWNVVTSPSAVLTAYRSSQPLASLDANCARIALPSRLTTACSASEPSSR
jgi:hypothetical protein